MLVRERNFSVLALETDQSPKTDQLPEHVLAVVPLLGPLLAVHQTLLTDLQDLHQELVLAQLRENLTVQNTIPILDLELPHRLPAIQLMYTCSPATVEGPWKKDLDLKFLTWP